MKSITLSDQAWAAIGNAIDIAVKAGGIRAAAELVPIFQEIESQLVKQANEQKPE